MTNKENLPFTFAAKLTDLLPGCHGYIAGLDYIDRTALEAAKVFPLWMEVLGQSEVVIEGVDHKIHDEPEAYRASVAQIKYDPLSLGALVTTHKMGVYSAAQDMFEYFDPYALITHEISSISWPRIPRR